MARKSLLFFAILISTAMPVLLSSIGMADTGIQLAGIWNGDLEVSPGKVLDCAIIVNSAQVDSLSGVFRIIGQGDLAIDTIVIEDSTVTFSVNTADFKIVGVVDQENDSIISEFRQGDTIIPLHLKRDNNPENDILQEEFR